jgi:hypothetical protein
MPGIWESESFVVLKMLRVSISIAEMDGMMERGVGVGAGAGAEVPRHRSEEEAEAEVTEALCTQEATDNRSCDRERLSRTFPRFGM